MTQYEENLKVLEKHYPGMAELIQKAKENLKTELVIMEEISADGQPVLKVRKDEKICYLAGKRNTKEPVDIWIETLGDLVENAPVFIMGTGNWLYLKALAERTEKRLAIIVYEPSLEIFMKFLEYADLEKWMDRHTIIFWIEGLEDMDKRHFKQMAGGILKYETIMYSRRFIVPNYETLFPDQALSFMKLCWNVINDERACFNTKNTFSTVMVKNLLANARYLCKGYKTTQLVEVIPMDIPGIVVAAGPSLNKNIEELKKAKGKALIIAVDTAIKPLLKAGIVPDMFFIVDALKPLDLIKIEEAKDIPLITTLNAASDLLDFHKGQKFFFNEGWEFADKIFEKSEEPLGTVPSGGSVATNIFSLYYKIGLSTVILVGQDLAYTNNKSHADGTFQEVMKEENTNGFEMVEGNYEEKVPTRPDFKLYLNWYNEVIEGFKAHRENFRVINATEGGAKIKGTEIMTLKEAIEQECTKEVDIQEQLKKLSPMLDEKSAKWAVDYLKNLPEKFHQLSADAEKEVQIYKKLDKICGKKNLDSAEYISALKKIKKQNKKIEENELYQLVQITMSQAQYIMGQEQYQQEQSIQEEGREIARKGILYTQNVKKAALLFEEMAYQFFHQENKAEWENI